MLPFFWGYVGVARGVSEGMELPPIFATDSLMELVARLPKRLRPPSQGHLPHARPRVTFPFVN